MKCIFCKGPLIKKEQEYKEYGIALGRFPALVCQQCGESFFEEEVVKDIQQQSKARGLFGLSKKVKVGKIGDSLMIRIPKDIAKFIKLKEGKEVRISPLGEKLIIDRE